MPSPNCPRCEGRTFTASPYGMHAGTQGYVLVFCTTCGCVVGILSQ